MEVFKNRIKEESQRRWSDFQSGINSLELEEKNCSNTCNKIFYNCKKNPDIYIELKL